jgi:hypothetical protein
MLVSSVPQLHTKWAPGAPRAAAEPPNRGTAARLAEVEPDHLVAVGRDEAS